MIEVLKQALELVIKSKRYAEECSHMATQNDCDHFDAVAENLRKAIQEEALRNVQRIGQEIEQEPLAHTLNCVCGAVWDIKADGSEEMVHTPNTTPPQGIYYTSPQRTWVGLTDEEVDECYYWKDRQWTTDELVRHVEAKLKERNS